MTTKAFHIAQFNVSKIKAPLDSPTMKEFVDFLAPVNRFAEESPGFIWRLAAEDGQASSFLPPAYSDPMVVTNLTVWQDIESLRSFVYQTVHTYFLRSRKKWFDAFEGQQVVLWWIEQRHIPTLEEAKEKLSLLETNGPTLQAFTFHTQFDTSGNLIKREAD